MSDTKKIIEKYLGRTLDDSGAKQILYANVLTEKKGIIQAKIDIIESLVDQIQSETEWDIWFPAWEKVREGTRKMKNLLDNGAIR